MNKLKECVKILYPLMPKFLWNIPSFLYSCTFVVQLCSITYVTYNVSRVPEDESMAIDEIHMTGLHTSLDIFETCFFFNTLLYVVKTILINFCTRNFAINMIEYGRIDATYEIIVTPRCLFNYLWTVYSGHILNVSGWFYFFLLL